MLTPTLLITTTILTIIIRTWLHPIIRIPVIQTWCIAQMEACLMIGKFIQCWNQRSKVNRIHLLLLDLVFYAILRLYQIFGYHYGLYLQETFWIWTRLVLEEMYLRAIWVGAHLIPLLSHQVVRWTTTWQEIVEVVNDKDYWDYDIQK